jgi:hypothetical protein
MIRRDIRGGSSEHETQNGGLRNFFIKSVGETTNLNQSSDCTPSFFPNRWPYTMDTRPNHSHRWRSGLSPRISHCQPCARTFRSRAVCYSQVCRSWYRQLQVLVVMPFTEITTPLVR